MLHGVFEASSAVELARGGKGAGSSAQQHVSFHVVEGTAGWLLPEASVRHIVPLDGAADGLAIDSKQVAELMSAFVTANAPALA